MELCDIRGITTILYTMAYATLSSQHLWLTSQYTMLLKTFLY